MTYLKHENEIWIIYSSNQRQQKNKNYQKQSTSEGTCFAAVSKSGCQSQDSSRANPDTTGSPTTLCPEVRKQTSYQLKLCHLGTKSL
jgi:hypothetical protein